jgi:hypothetical protein
MRARARACVCVCVCVYVCVYANINNVYLVGDFYVHIYVN